MEKEDKLKYYFHDSIPCISYSDSSSQKGIYDVFLFKKTNKKYIINEEAIKSYVKNNDFDKIVFHADEKNVIEVPLSYNEGKSESWQYDYNFSCKISLYKNTSDKWISLDEKMIENEDGYNNLVNKLKKEYFMLRLKKHEQFLDSISKLKIDEFWFKNYTFWLESYTSSYNYYYELKVDKDSSYIKERLLNDVLVPLQKNDTLFLYHKKSISDFRFTKDKQEPEVIIIKVGDEYYVKSQVFDLKNSISNKPTQYGFLVDEVN